MFHPDTSPLLIGGQEERSAFAGQVSGRAEGVGPAAPMPGRGDPAP